MAPSAYRNDHGFSLIEVLVSLLVTLLVFVALMQTAMISINSNMRNVLRDEAVAVAGAQMNQMRSIPYKSLAVGATSAAVTRSLRNIPTFNYTVTQSVTALGSDDKQVNITVSWQWKNKSYTHSIGTILSGR